MRHQVFCFSPLVFSTATALDNCFHSRNMRLWRPGFKHTAFENKGRLSRYALPMTARTPHDPHETIYRSRRNLPETKIRCDVPD
jgi:hypothetical protein